MKELVALAFNEVLNELVSFVRKKFLGRGLFFILSFSSRALLSFYLFRLNNESRTFFRLYSVELERSGLEKIRKSTGTIHIAKESRRPEDEKRVKKLEHENIPVFHLRALGSP